MSLHYLYNLPRLEVPQIHFVVFAAGDNPLVTCHAETRGDAVLFVFVPGVSLQTARGLVVPETDGAVVGGGEDVTRIGGELDVLAGETGERVC